MDKKGTIEKIKNGNFDLSFKLLYGESALEHQRNRYISAIEKFSEIFPEREDIHIFSAPGRSEICGNHTDHQHGCVLAASVNLDVIAIVSFHKDSTINIKSEKYPMINISLKDLSVHEEEKGQSASIVRGIAARFNEMGVNIGGFDAYTTSDVLSGSGLSSSAAFEILVGTIIDKHYNNGKAGAVEIAKIGQYAENEYFGKKSGLMDQMVSSVGNFVFIDFADTEKPYVESVSCSFEKAGYSLCITDTKGSHADLTSDYVAVPTEMNSVAEQLGKKYLRETDESEFMNAISSLREKCSDRAIIRAAHFFGENRRAKEAAEFLKNGKFDAFLNIVRESGNSSAKWLQNLYSCSKPSEQGITLALMVSEQILGSKGVSRVHGGGFAGTVQAFVPTDMTEEYCRKMDDIFGKGSCYVLRIRPVGGVEITEYME